MHHVLSASKALIGCYAHNTWLLMILEVIFHVRSLMVNVCFLQIRVQREAGELKQIVYDGDILDTLGK